MANIITENMLKIDTAAVVIDTTPGRPERVQVMQWINDDNAAGGAILAADNLALTINQIPINIKASAIGVTTPWQVLFTIPILVTRLSVDTIDGGTLIIWTG